MPEEDEEGFFDFILQEKIIKMSEAMRGRGDDQVRRGGGKVCTPLKHART